MRRPHGSLEIGLRAFGVFGTALLATGLLLVAGARTAKADDAKPDEAKDSKAAKPVQLAVIELSGSYPEGAGEAGLFGEVSENLNRIIERIDQAGKDEKISGLILEFRDLELGRGKAHEMRAAIARVRKSGKKVYADLRSGEASDYLLASACDEIVMPESGTLAVAGVRAEVTFFKDLLDKLGIQAEILQKGAYKGTGEIFTRSGMSREFREDIDSLVDDFYTQLIDTIASDRKLDRGRVKDLVDQGIFSATDAKAAGLIDRVAYRDQLIDELKKSMQASEIKLVENYGKKKLDEDFSGFNGFLKLMQMLTGNEPSQTSGKNPKIAVIYAVGEIVDGKGGGGLFTSEACGGDTMIKAIRDAESNPKVVAIVLRIDSPGGSALASDLVWREVVTCKKPIVASMGDVAASGGYYIAMGAKKIIAEPGTITGSIGVVGGKVALKGLMDKVGITTSVVSRGKNSGWQSEIDPFTPSEREAWSKSMDDMYRQFTTKAAKGRKIDLKHLQDDLAGGRVFTGRVAVGKKLVDSVGTLDDALAAAKSLAGLKPDEAVDRLNLPKPKTLLESLFGDSQEDDEFIPPRLQSRLGKQLGSLGRTYGEAEQFTRLFNRPAVLVLPYRLEIK
ncbi:MAG TPA: signal peptide peptidase SppA [Pirellulales bacterium]|jgi:protease-4|nr:signal peptide peptidase SppA [Pirellulales bacterium]